MRVIGLDVSRTFAKIAYLEGRSVGGGGRVELQKGDLDAFAQRLRRADKVVLEATANYQPLNIDPHRFLSALGTAQLPSLRRPVEL